MAHWQGKACRGQERAWHGQKDARMEREVEGAGRWADGRRQVGKQLLSSAKRPTAKACCFEMIRVLQNAQGERVSRELICIVHTRPI
mmetsp:Transcript_9800/g.18488  ORF Transcript_9800/g.18488 Transcript_9800/m.18488 type:complete len:87 (+) Transcript_9800:346-606(+)